MSKISLMEITESQLASTPIVNGQIIVTSDTQNIYRDFTNLRIPVGKDLIICNDLPLAPISGKLYLVLPNSLYYYNTTSSSWVMLNSTDSELLDRIDRLEKLLFTTLKTSNGKILQTSNGKEIQRCLYSRK